MPEFLPRDTILAWKLIHFTRHPCNKRRLKRFHLSVRVSRLLFSKHWKQFQRLGPVSSGAYTSPGAIPNATERISIYIRPEGYEQRAPPWKMTRYFRLPLPLRPLRRCSLVPVSRGSFALLLRLEHFTVQQGLCSLCSNKSEINTQPASKHGTKIRQDPPLTNHITSTLGSSPPPILFLSLPFRGTSR